MQTLNQDIKEKTFKRVYLLFGDEPFLVNSYKKRLREAIAGDDTMNYNYFEGKGPDVKEIISLADTMPFFAERQRIFQEQCAGGACELYRGDPGIDLHGLCGERGR